MIYVGLPVCNIEPLIGQVITSLIRHTETNFHLVICDNGSKDNTLGVVRETIQKEWGNKLAENAIFTIISLPERVTALECTNKSLSRAMAMSYDMVVKLDHDYGVPPLWDSTILRIFQKYPQYRLLSPSVKKETPKGMQYYSQGASPQLISKLDLSDTVGEKIKSDTLFPSLNRELLLSEYRISEATIYHYDGVAGYCHCVPQAVFEACGGSYRAMNAGAVFGSEDADWSLRSSPSISTKGYIMELEGWHWSKPSIGAIEDEYKGEATFLKTSLTLEDWVKSKYPEEYEKYYGYNER
jgi:glycosyltransferase involved in cell wall biosynthesis